MKNKLYEIFDAITMVFSPLIESLFDYAEVLIARRGEQSGKRRLEAASDAADLQDARATGTRHSESFGW